MIKNRLQSLFTPSLDYLLQSAQPNAPLEARILWIEQLLNWIRIPVWIEQKKNQSAQIQTVRVRYFFQLLERNPTWQKNVSELFTSVLLQTEGLRLFARTGLMQESGFLGEFLNRVLRKVLPAPVESKELSDLFLKVFHDETDARWILNLDPITSEKITRMMIATPEAKVTIGLNLRHSMMEALLYLSSQVEALGLSAEIWDRSQLSGQAARIRNSAFYKLRVLINRWENEGQASLIEIKTLLSECQKEKNTVLLHLEDNGVSIAIVYRIEQLENLLKRMEILADVLCSTSEELSAKASFKLVSDLIHDTIESTRVRGLIQNNLQMLSRKIIERTGNSGEHYITQTPQEYLQLLLSAAGGGILTAGTTFIKFFIIGLQAALFFEGFFSWINYAGSFLAMQGLHFTLATKQPSMTAPALAAKLKNMHSRDQVAEFVDEVAKITRSQFAAALGNIGAVIPSAYLADVIYKFVTGSHVVEAKHAAAFVHSLNPFHTLTVPFAALTGVCLWLSSVCAGWFENWIVYRRLPASWLTRNAAGIAGNISLGFFLGFVPILGRFFGMPFVQTPHVTLTTGSFIFSLCGAQPGDISPNDVALSALCIIGIGLLNFGVSFALALYVALKARKIRKAWLFELVEGIGLVLRFKPLSFLLPK